MKISELEIGKQYIITLVVSNATARKTKAGKPYLALEFFDGLTTIGGNYWDWAGKVIPEKNTVLNVSAQVTEWQGSPQLNISGMTINTEVSLDEFMPSSGLNPKEIWLRAKGLVIQFITDEFYAQLCTNLLEELKESWLLVPAAVSIHHAYVAGTLIHSVSTALTAAAIAKENHEIANVSLAVAGALLHDIGKLFCYSINGVVCNMTDEGLLYEHSFVGAEFVGNYAEEHHLLTSPVDEAKLELLRHIILSHHGKREYGSVIPPASIEAHIVHHADALDATFEEIKDACSRASLDAKFTERIWAQDSRPHITIAYTKGILE